MAEEKVIYIENEKQSDWNFGTYFRSIKRFKWWVIGATVISAVLGFLAFKFIVNPSSKTLVATFSYDLAATPEGENSFRFIDGTLFNYYDIVSKENLIAVKDGQKDLFHSIDANVLYAGNEIKIEKVSVKDGNSAQESVAFKISAKSKSFTSDKVGKEYLYALINHPKSISSQAINNYSIPSLTEELNSALPYEKQLSILEEQYQTIEDAYSSLETVFGQAAIVNGEGESLNVASNKFKTYYNNGTVNIIGLALDSIYSNYFINYEEGKETDKINEIQTLCGEYIESVKSYQQKRDIDQNALSKLITGSQIINTSDSSYATKIVQLSESVANYNRIINSLDKQLNLYGKHRDSESDPYVDTPDSVIKKLQIKDPVWVKRNKAFKQGIQNLKEALEKDIKTANDVYKHLYLSYKNKVILRDNGYITIENGKPNIYGILIGLGVGFVVSSLTVMIVSVYSDKKEKPSKSK